MNPLLSFVLELSRALDPTHDHAEISDAIAEVVQAERPLFANDESREKTASLIVAVAWREGSLRTNVIGDCVEKTKDGACIAHPRSFCTMQIHASSGGNSSLNDDPKKCILAGLSMLRSSMRACTEHPLAFYAGGPAGCASPRAQRISRDRLALAARTRTAAVAALGAHPPPASPSATAKAP